VVKNLVTDATETATIHSSANFMISVRPKDQYKFGQIILKQKNKHAAKRFNFRKLLHCHTNGKLECHTKQTRQKA
jgi:hypothetical protein